MSLSVASFEVYEDCLALREHGIVDLVSMVSLSEADGKFRGGTWRRHPIGWLARRRRNVF